MVDLEQLARPRERLASPPASIRPAPVEAPLETDEAPMPLPGRAEVVALGRWGLVLLIFLLARRSPLASQAFQGVLLAEAVGFFLVFFIDSDRWTARTVAELLLLAAAWWLWDRLAGAPGLPEGVEARAMVWLFFLGWLPLRVVVPAARALQADAGDEDAGED